MKLRPLIWGLLLAAAAFSLAQDPEQLRVPILDRLGAQLEIAAAAVDSGDAAAKLEAWAAATRSS